MKVPWGSSVWLFMPVTVSKPPTPSRSYREGGGLSCSVLIFGYQRIPTLIGITFVPAATLVVPSPFGCVVTAGVRTSTNRASANSFILLSPYMPPIRCW